MIPTFSSNFKSTLVNLRPYVGIWLLFALGIGTVLLTLGYYDSFLLLNSYRSPLLDKLMPHFTHMGEGVLLASLFSLLILKKDRALTQSLLCALLLVGLLMYAFKQFVFIDWDRPPIVFKYFEDIFYLSLGGERYNSFPSGHSAAIWMVLTYIAYFFRNNSFWLSILCGLLAVSVALSRIYIGVHFPGDILMGSFIGVSIALLTLSSVYPKIKKRFELNGLPKGMMSLWLGGLFLCTLLGSVYFLYQHYYRV